jgi:hypothetical protein
MRSGTSHPYLRGAEQKAVSLCHCVTVRLGSSGAIMSGASGAYPQKIKRKRYSTESGVMDRDDGKSGADGAGDRAW